MKSDPGLLAREVERTVYEYSSAWEGKQEQEIDLGEALLRVQPRFAAALRLHFDATNVDERLDKIIEQVKERTRWCLWIIFPSTEPPDLEDRLLARGFRIAIEWEGLALDDLSRELTSNPDVVIEQLSWENADEYAAHCTGSPDPHYYAYLLASAHRFLQTPHQEVQIFVARLDGLVAGYAVLRIEPNGVAYLRDALTVPEFRQRGVYSSLVAHRIALARATGCTIAVLQAQTRTSAPILVKRGFKPVCRIVGLARRDDAHK